MCVVLHMLSLPSLKKQWIWFSACFHSTLNKQWKNFHILSLLRTNQCMGFSTCCHSSFSNISGCTFSCAFKAHSVGPGWISISRHCCFNKQWISFSTCCHCPLEKAVDGFPSCHYSELTSVWVFDILSLLSFKRQ